MNSVCRTCLNIIKGDALKNHLGYSNTSNDVNDREKLETCVPELTVDIVLNPLMCNTCKDNLSTAFLFKLQCLETERTLFNYIQARKQNQNCTDLLSNQDLLLLVKNEIISEHNYSNLTLNFLQENDHSRVVFPSCLQSVTHIKMEENYGDTEYTEPANDDIQNKESVLKPKHTAPPQAKEGPKPKKKPNVKLKKQKKIKIKFSKPDKLSIKSKKKIDDKKEKNKNQKCKESPKKNLEDEQKENAAPKFNNEKPVKIKTIKENEEDVNNEVSQIIVVPVPLQFEPEPEPRKPKLTYRSIPRYQCTKCDKAFSYRCHFNIHLKSHIFKKLYSCPICDKAFSQDKYLKAHRLMHMKKALFQCALCKKCLSSQTSLQRHIKTHSEERPYKCDQCDKRFRQRIQLNVHKRTHAGLRPFICNLCNADFSQKCHLVSHIRSHTGERPYQCEKCIRRFPKTTALQVHMKIHDRKPYQCNGCTRFFGELTDYRKHVSKNFAKCVAGRRIYKATKSKSKSKALQEIDDDINKINQMAIDLMERDKKLARLKFTCVVCNKGFTTNYSRNRHLKYQHFTK